MSAVPTLPKPPYYVVVFVSRRSSDDEEGYQQMSARMLELAREQDGFLGVESARDATGHGITVSRWRDEAAIQAWKSQLEHRDAQNLGREKWYDYFTLEVARVERTRNLSRMPSL